MRGVLDYLNRTEEDAEVIVVDDGSRDDTAVVAERAVAECGAVSARVIRYEPNRGKGYAVRLGLLASGANIALFSDADLSTPITETPKLVDPIRNHECDLTFGSRALDRSLIGTHQPWRREQGGRVFNLIVRTTTGLPYWATQCGFKAFRMDVWRPLIEATKIERFGFDVELIYLAHLAGLRFRHVPVPFDHVAPVRQARRAPEPRGVAAAMICEQAGADGITIHLRGDRRHIQDADLTVLRQAVTAYLNVEMAATEEMIKIAIDVRPDAVSLVPENPKEITTEGGLNVRPNISIVRAAGNRLVDSGIVASLFIDPDPQQIQAAREVNVQHVELCTAADAEATLGSHGIHGEGAVRANQELRRLREGAALAAQYGLHVAAAHGLTLRNGGAGAQTIEIEKFNIGHSIISNPVFLGLERPVRQMRAAIS